MYVHSIKLKNYKSIGETLNRIIIEPNITAIIGKNESGKSNVLEGISHISFLNNMQSAFNSEDVNRNTDVGSDIEYEIVLCPSLDDEEIGIIGESTVVINKNTNDANGGIKEFINNKFRKEAASLLEILERNPFKLRDKDYTLFANYISMLKIENPIDLKRINDCVNYINARIERADIEFRDDIDKMMIKLTSIWKDFCVRLPVFFYRKSSKILKTNYKYEEVQKELSNPQLFPDSLLYDFVNLIGINQEDFLNAVQSGNVGSKLTIRDRIRRSVDGKINSEFNKFYSAEKVILDVSCDNNTISFSVRSNDGEMLSLSERSNGLRWYINTFIDALAHGIKRQNVVYLFDEPGTSLHVNAQKELLTLLESLAHKGNQIVYTTHSPYMLNLDSNGIERIRSVVKNDDGNTYIYKNAYDGRISNDSQQDTLAPIINAIGMNLNDTFGPTNCKLNIVCEGVSDYIYLHTISKLIDIDVSKINIIPAIGVTNSINIISILKGWGCEVFAIFDFDKEGVEKGGLKLEKSSLCEKNYTYVIDIEQNDIDTKKYNKQPCVIEDLIGRDVLNEFAEKHHLPTDATANNKTLLAKMFCDALNSEEVVLSEDCKKKFVLLFEKALNVKQD